MLEAFERYSSRRLIADGQIVHLIKYESPKTIPYGMHVKFNQVTPLLFFLLAYH